MTSHVRGVIARGKGEPVEVTTVLVPDPGFVPIARNRRFSAYAACP